MPAYAPVAQIGTATLWECQPEIDPVVRALCAVSLAADNINSYRSMRLNRRGHSGVMRMEEQPYRVVLEAYGPTREECERAIARYLDGRPWAIWRTSFAAPREIDSEWVAFGSRNSIEGWC